MLPEDLHNPETAAIGLDVAALEGKSIAEIRTIVDRDDCALVVATEDVPPHFPPEVMLKEPNAHEGKPSLSWMYQTDGGEWRYWYGYVVDHDFVRRGEEPPTEIILAQIYTRRARATPGMRVRPIATLTFDLKGICLYASDAEPQLHIARVRSEEREAAVQPSPSPKPRTNTNVDPILGQLVKPFGLAAPRDGITIDDWNQHDPGTGRFGWIGDVDLEHLMLIRARMGWRLAIIPAADGPGSLAAREGDTLWPPVALDERGLHVAFRSQTGDAGPGFAVYAGNLGLGIVIVDGQGRRFTANALVAQTTWWISPTEVHPAVLIRGHQQRNSDSTQTVTARLVHLDETLEVTSPSGTESFRVIEVRHSDLGGSILISARRA